MPPVSMMLPARMKKGIAASGNLLIALNISFTEISMLALPTWMPRIEARPIDTATETVSAKHSTIVESIAASGAHCAVSSSRRCGSSRLPMMPRMLNTPPTGIAR
jgi:hypothetical protein